MNVWVFRRGEWEPRPAPASPPPGGLGLGGQCQALTPDASVNLWVGEKSAEFPYTVSMRFGGRDPRRQEWVCIPDLPSLLELMRLIAPMLRNEVAVQSYLTAMLDERLGPPADRSQPTSSSRDLTAMNTVLFSDESISADLEGVAASIEENPPAASARIDMLVRDLTGIRAQITTENDPNGTRFDAVIALLQSASLLLLSSERDAAIVEVKKALAAWRLDDNGPLLP